MKRTTRQLLLLAVLLYLIWLLQGCTYIPVAADYPSYKEGDFIQHVGHDNWIYWIGAETKDGYSYHKAYTEYAYQRCERENGSHAVACTLLPEGKFVMLYPWWYWHTLPPGARNMIMNEEECHVSAAQSGVEDRCHE